MKVSLSLNGGRAVVIALLVSILITVGYISLLAGLIVSGTLPESALSPASVIGLILSSFAGAVVSARGGETKIAVRVILLGILYMLILLTIGILVLDGPISNLWINGLCILLGCVAACAICIRKRKTGKQRKKAIR